MAHQISPSASTVRQVTRVIQARTHRNGDGTPIHRPFPTKDLSGVDPFLVLDQIGPAQLEHGKAGGELERRCEGIDVVTHVVRGALEHEDGTGFRTVLRTGDVQWLTTGSGLVFSQLPSRAMRQQGGPFHVLQIRIDLPAPLRALPPRYQTFSRSYLPEVVAAGARITVVAGEALGARGPVETNTPTTFQLWSLEPGVGFTLPVPTAQRAFVYVLAGTVGVGGDEREPLQLGEGELGLLSPGDGVRIHGYVAPEEASLVLLAAGVPVGSTR